MEIGGKVALITGAGSGIGRATALRLAQEGAKVVAADIDAVSGDETAELIVTSGGDAIFVRVDVRKDAELQGLFDAAEQRYGGVDFVFNNAGITSGLPIWPDEPPEKWQRTLDVNLTAVIRGTQ